MSSLLGSQDAVDPMLMMSRSSVSASSTQLDYVQLPEDALSSVPQAISHLQSNAASIAVLDRVPALLWIKDDVMGRVSSRQETALSQQHLQAKQLAKHAETHVKMAAVAALYQADPRMEHEFELWLTASAGNTTRLSSCLLRHTASGWEALQWRDERELPEQLQWAAKACQALIH